jgi:carboxyl-terminal processing protease
MSRLSYASLGNELVEAVRTSFFDADRAARWSNRNRGYASAINDEATFARETNWRLAELGASHTEYFPPSAPKADELRTIFEHLFGAADAVSIGAQVEPLDKRFFVVSVLPDGPAARAGLLRGDEIVAVDDQSFNPDNAWPERPLAIAIRRHANGPVQTIDVVPQRGSIRKAWLAAERSGSRIVLRSGKQIAYAWMWTCAGQDYEQLLAERLTSDFTPADGLVIDFRDGWGGCNPTFVNLFNQAVPTMRSVGHDGRARLYSPAWKKPLVLLINHRTRSGKELVSRALQRAGRALVVGERSAGAVLAGKPIKLSNGGILYLAAADLLIDGERLEGVGVTPEVPVDDRLPFAAGSDPLLERALDAAADLAKREAERSAAPGFNRARDGISR